MCVGRGKINFRNLSLIVCLLVQNGICLVLVFVASLPANHQNLLVLALAFWLGYGTSGKERRVENPGTIRCVFINYSCLNVNKHMIMLTEASNLNGINMNGTE